MPAISGPLMISSGAVPSATLQFEVGDEPFFGAFDDVVGEALIERQIGRFAFSVCLRPRKNSAMARDVVLVDRRLSVRRSAGASRQSGHPITGRRRVEEQSIPPAAFFFGNGGETLQLFRVDDGEVESGFRAVVQEDGIDHFARGGGKSERDIGNAQRGLDVRDVLLDQPEGFDGFDCAADVVRIARRAGENQRIDDDVFRRECRIWWSGDRPSAARPPACARA